MIQKLVTEKIIEVLNESNSPLTSNKICDKLKGCLKSSVRGRLSEKVKQGKIKQQIRQDGQYEYWVEK